MLCEAKSVSSSWDALSDDTGVPGTGVNQMVHLLTCGLASAEADRSEGDC